MDNKEIEKRVEKCLKKYGELPTTKIAVYTGLNYSLVKSFLENSKKFKSRKKQFEFSESRGVYWRVNGNEK